MPPASIVADLPAPPLFTAKTSDELALDDQRRMKLLGQCVIENNAKALWVRTYCK